MALESLLLLSNPPLFPVDASGSIVAHIPYPEHDGSSQSIRPSPSSSMPLSQISCKTGAVGQRAPSLLALDGPKAKRFESIPLLPVKSCTLCIT